MISKRIRAPIWLRMLQIVVELTISVGIIVFAVAFLIGGIKIFMGLWGIEYS